MNSNRMRTDCGVLGSQGEGIDKNLCDRVMVLFKKHFGIIIASKTFFPEELLKKHRLRVEDLKIATSNSFVIEYIAQDSKFLKLILDYFQFCINNSGYFKFEFLDLVTKMYEKLPRSLPRGAQTKNKEEGQSEVSDDEEQSDVSGDDTDDADDNDESEEEDDGNNKNRQKRFDEEEEEVNDDDDDDGGEEEEHSEVSGSGSEEEDEGGNRIMPQVRQMVSSSGSEEDDEVGNRIMPQTRQMDFSRPLKKVRRPGARYPVAYTSQLIITSRSNPKQLKLQPKLLVRTNNDESKLENKRLQVVESMMSRVNLSSIT